MLGDDGNENEESGMLADFPEEELLRLDDGTPLPAQLTELRSLLQLHALAASTEIVAPDDDPDAAERLAELAATKAEMLRDCLLDFDEGLLLSACATAKCPFFEQPFSHATFSPLGSARQAARPRDAREAARGRSQAQRRRARGQVWVR